METDKVIEKFLIDIPAVEIKKYLSLYKLQLFVSKNMTKINSWMQVI